MPVASRLRLPLAAAAVVAAVATPLPAVAQADPPPAGGGFGWLDLIAPDLLARRLVQSGIVALRTQAEVRYDAISVDLVGGQVALTGLEVRPFLDWDDDFACVMAADRVVVDLGSPIAADRVALLVELTGATADPACLAPDARPALAMLGQEFVSLDHLRIAADYRLSTAAADLAIHATLPGIAAVDLTAAFDYVSLKAPGGGDPVPSVYLTEGQMTVEDLGGMAVLRSALPPELSDPVTAAAMVGAQLRGELEQANRRAERRARLNRGDDPSAPFLAPLTEEQRRFLDTMAAEITRVLSGSGQVALAVGHPDGDATFLDFEAWEDDPREVFAALAPRFAPLPPVRTRIVPADLLRRAIETPETLNDGERLTAGMALLTGVGAPRHVQAGSALLTPLAAAGDGAVGLALAQANAASAPDEAYRMALLAAATREAGALALLDRIEATLSMPAILSAQTAAAGAEPGPMPDTLSGLRAEALGYLTGSGVPRSYSLAWFWASLGAAAGDAASAAMRDEIERRIDARGAEARAAWSRATAPVSEALFRAWLDDDLPAVLTER